MAVVVTNLGSSLDPTWVARYGIALTTVHLVVDGEHVDTRSFKTLADIDALIKRAKKHPHVLGTSAAEFIPTFSELQRQHGEIVVVTTSRRTIGSYEAAIAAARTMRTLTRNSASISVVDSGTLDLGVGLVALFCARSLQLGHRGDELVAAAEAVGRAGRFTYTPLTLDYLVRGGRANFLVAQAAELFNRRPLLGFVDGQNHKLGTISKSADAVEAIVGDLVANLGKGTSVWAGVMHGDIPAEAQRLADALRSVFDVRELAVRETSAGVYMNVGRGAFGAFVTPIASMPWPVTLDLGN